MKTSQSDMLLERLLDTEKNRTIALELSGFNLKQIPNEVFEFDFLEALYLDNNQLATLDSRITQLKSLRALNLGNNKLNIFPTAAYKLSNLEELYLYGNSIPEVPSNWNQLQQLRLLDISCNEIRDFPITKAKGYARASSPPKLEMLYLSKNKIQQLPKDIDLLETLTELDLRENDLKKIPHSVSYIDGLKSLQLQGNVIESPPLEIAMKGIGSIRNYFYQMADSATVEVYEAKVLIVGEGHVGKSWLLNRLIHDTINPDLVSTEGIEIERERGEVGGINDFQVNYWDFGGQEIYHSTHQFFLTRRSVYLFVWAARTDDDLTSFDYWLNIVRLLGDNAPVIVVLNKADERLKSIDELSVQRKFPNVVEFFKVSAKTGMGIQPLREKIKQCLVKLDHVGTKLPEKWVHIRKELESLNNDYIKYDDYIRICRKHGLVKNQANYMSEYFHDIGLFLHFSDSGHLSDIVFLKPEWATNAVYQLVDRKEVINNNGKFSIKDLERFWNTDYFSNHTYLVELMKKFELCFELGEGKYVIPELLTVSEPAFEWRYRDNLRVEYHYDFMPAGIVARLIARNHNIIEKGYNWKNGVIFQENGARALIKCETINRRLKIWIDGNNRESLLKLVAREISTIHRTLNYPDLELKIPCICEECKLTDSKAEMYDLSSLRVLEDSNEEYIFCVRGRERVPVKTLMIGYGGVQTYDKKSDPIEKKEHDVAPEVKEEIPNKTQWWKYSAIAGVIAALAFLLVTYIPSDYLLARISIVIGFSVFAFMMTRNPIRRYINAFYIVLTMAIASNGFPYIGKFLFKNNSTEVQFSLSSPDFGINLIMGLICIVLLVLDYKERNSSRLEK